MHTIPLYYTVDQHMTVNSRIKGENLEVQTHMILVKNKALMTLVKIIRTLNFHIQGIVYDGLGLGDNTLTEQERMQGGIIFDIGGQFPKFISSNIMHCIIQP